jgi:hypothetical protein
LRRHYQQIAHAIIVNRNTGAPWHRAASPCRFGLALRTRFNKQPSSIVEPRVLYISPSASCDAAFEAHQHHGFRWATAAKALDRRLDARDALLSRFCAVLLALCARRPLRNAVCRAACWWRRLADLESPFRLLQIACRVIGREHYVTNCAVIPLPLALPELTVAHPARPPPAHRVL